MRFSAALDAVVAFLSPDAARRRAVARAGIGRPHANPRPESEPWQDRERRLARRPPPYFGAPLSRFTGLSRMRDPGAHPGGVFRPGAMLRPARQPVGQRRSST